LDQIAELDSGLDWYIRG